MKKAFIKLHESSSVVITNILVFLILIIITEIFFGYWFKNNLNIKLASERNIPLHPGAPKMIKIKTDEWRFDENDIDAYRRLSVRECARIQGFPDDYEFKYDRITHGYKMVGNAVPINLAKVLAQKIMKDIKE